MSAEQYFEAAGVSKSSLDYIAPPYSPAHFRARFITKELKDEETPAKRMGALTHRFILESDTVQDAFWVKPEGMKFTNKDGISWRDEHSDRPIITSEEAEAIRGMREAVWRHPTAKRLLTGSQTEQNLFATDADGVLRKGRIDILKPGYPIADLKTVASADEDWFTRQNAECRWFCQASWYCTLAEMLELDCQYDFTCIAVEKTPPYDVVCYDFTDLLQAGRLCNQRDLALLRECREKDEWPGRANGFVPATLPVWQMKQLEQLGIA